MFDDIDEVKYGKEGVNMAEVLGILSVMGVVFLLLIAWAVRSDYKAMRKGKDELIASWEKYYERSQEYKPIESFALTYTDGSEEIVEGLKFNNGGDYVEIYDEYGKVVCCVNKSELKILRTERSEYVINGPKEKETII